MNNIEIVIKFPDMDEVIWEVEDRNIVSKNYEYGEMNGLPTKFSEVMTLEDIYFNIMNVVVKIKIDGINFIYYDEESEVLY